MFWKPSKRSTKPYRAPANRAWFARGKQCLQPKMLSTAGKALRQKASRGMESVGHGAMATAQIHETHICSGKKGRSRRKSDRVIRQVIRRNATIHRHQNTARAQARRRRCATRVVSGKGASGAQRYVSARKRCTRGARSAMNPDAYGRTNHHVQSTNQRNVMRATPNPRPNMTRCHHAAGRCRPRRRAVGR